MIDFSFRIFEGKKYSSSLAELCPVILDLFFFYDIDSYVSQNALQRNLIIRKRDPSIKGFFPKKRLLARKPKCSHKDLEQMGLMIAGNH